MKTLLIQNLLENACFESEIILDREETAAFYDERQHWGKDIKVVSRMGDYVTLPWRALPSRAHVQERYFVNGTEIKPAFAYWGLANQLRPRGTKDVN